MTIQNCILFAIILKWCDLNNYKDVGHYSEKINSQMLGWMHEGEYRLTWDNYEGYLEEIYEFYGGYDYDVLFN